MEIDIPDLNDVEFETNCYSCRPVYSSKPPREDCIHCRGTGLRLTEVGGKLIKFLRDRGVVMATPTKKGE